MTHSDSPNPLLLTWVKEWLDVARERNSKGVTTYRNAYESLKACPIAFTHPTELQQLKGFGPKLCERLTDKLRAHCAETGQAMPEHPQARRQVTEGGGASNSGREGGDGGDVDENNDKHESEINDDEGGAQQQSKKKAKKTTKRNETTARKKPKQYVPIFRSGAYALVVALSTLDADNPAAGMTKTEIIDAAQPHCDTSFIAPSDPSSFYTAWNSMKTLVTKELVFERGRPLRRYALTDEGWEVAKRIRETAQCRGDLPGGGKDKDDDDDMDGKDKEGSDDADSMPVVSTAHIPAPDDTREPLVPLPSCNPITTTAPSLPSFTPILLPPGSFTVRLVLDNREVRTKKDREYMSSELAKLGCAPLTRALELGDAQWVAKLRDPAALARRGAEGDEVALDWIVERKRLDDLVASIKDGRFHEQKFRLGRSGAGRVIYLIEDMSLDPAYAARYEEAVRSAIAGTQVTNGYFVKRTQKMDDSIRYLARMTRMLSRLYEGRTLRVVPTNVLTAGNYLPLLSHLRQQLATTTTLSSSSTPSTPSLSSSICPGEGVEAVPAGLAGWYVSYTAFQALASKSDAMTLRDVFLRMLMTTKGVTGERALDLQRRWRTPADFVDAFRACGGDEAGKKRKRDLVATELAGLEMVGRKKMTRALSERIAEVWGDA